MRLKGRFSVRMCAGQGRDVCNKGAHGRLCAGLAGFFQGGLWRAILTAREAQDALEVVLVVRFWGGALYAPYLL